MLHCNFTIQKGNIDDNNYVETNKNKEVDKIIMMEVYPLYF